MSMRPAFSITRSLVLTFFLVCFVASSVFAAQKPVVIQGAMDVETKAMIDQLSDVKKYTFGGWNFYEGTFNNYPVVIAKTEIGMTNAAASTALAIEKFDPVLVINQGTSGGHDSALHRYDIVLGVQAVNFGAFRTEHADAGKGVAPAGWIPMTIGINVDGASKEFSGFKGDANIVALAKRVADTYKHGKVVEGVIGSADQWNRELDRIATIHKQYGTSVEEMETASSAQVAKAYGVPFLGIRILSNSEEHGEDFDPQAGVYCQEYVMNVVNAFVKAQ